MSGPASQPQWYLARDGMQYGPMSEAELTKFIELGHLLPTDLLWREGFPEWRPAMVVFPRRGPSAIPGRFVPPKPQEPSSPTPPPKRGTPPDAGWSTAVSGPQLVTELIGHALAGTAMGTAYSIGVLVVFLSAVLIVWIGCSFFAWLLAFDDSQVWLVTNKYLWQVALIMLVGYSFLQSKSFDIATRLRQLLRQEKDLSLAQAELSMLVRVQTSYASTIAELSAGILVFLATSLAWNAESGNIFSSGKVSNETVLSFTLDLVCRGLLFDIMEHFDITFTRARLNYSTWSYVLFSFIFRIYVSLLILKAIIDNFSAYLSLRRGRLQFEKAYKEARGELAASGAAS